MWCSREGGNGPALLHRALRAILLAALLPGAVQRKGSSAGALALLWMPLRSVHSSLGTLPWTAFQASCTQDNPDGKLEPASYYFIITARIMTGPERLIAAGKVSGQGTKEENKVRHGTCSFEEVYIWLSIALVRVLISKMELRVSS